MKRWASMPEGMGLVSNRWLSSHPPTRSKPLAPVKQRCGAVGLLVSVSPCLPGAPTPVRAGEPLGGATLGAR